MRCTFHGLEGRGGQGSGLHGCKRKGQDLNPGFLLWSTRFFAFQIPLKLTQFSYLSVELCGNNPFTDKMQMNDLKCNKVVRARPDVLGLLGAGWSFMILPYYPGKGCQLRAGHQVSMSLWWGETQWKSWEQTAGLGTVGLERAGEEERGGRGWVEDGWRLISGNSAEGLGPGQRTSFQDHFCGDKGSEKGS